LSPSTFIIAIQSHQNIPYQSRQVHSKYLSQAFYYNTTLSRQLVSQHTITHNWFADTRNSSMHPVDWGLLKNQYNIWQICLPISLNIKLV